MPEEGRKVRLCLCRRSDLTVRSLAASAKGSNQLLDPSVEQCQYLSCHAPASDIRRLLQEDKYKNVTSCLKPSSVTCGPDLKVSSRGTPTAKGRSRLSCGPRAMSIAAVGLNRAALNPLFSSDFVEQLRLEPLPPLPQVLPGMVRLHRFAMQLHDLLKTAGSKPEARRLQDPRS